jgi:transposase
VRTGWYREVAVKSMDSQTTRALLMARAQLVSQRQTTANLIRGLLKTFGLLVGQAGGGRFAGSGSAESHELFGPPARWSTTSGNAGSSWWLS